MRTAEWRTSPRQPKSDIRILIVDDEASVLEFVGRTLRAAGYSTEMARSGSEALSVAEHSGPFDLVVADVMMPNMTGDEMAGRLRQTYPDLRVLYLTGFSDRLFKEKTTLWAGEAFLDKPASVTGLLEAVSLLLSGHIRLDSKT